MIAHEVKNPLAAIETGLSLLLEGDTIKYRAKEKDIVQRIYRRSESLRQLVNDLLNINLFDKGTLIFEKNNVELIPFFETLLISSLVV